MTVAALVVSTYLLVGVVIALAMAAYERRQPLPGAPSGAAAWAMVIVLAPMLALICLVLACTPRGRG